MRFDVRGTIAFRQSLEKRFFLSASVVSRRQRVWVFEVDDGISSEHFRKALEDAK